MTRLQVVESFFIAAIISPHDATAIPFIAKTTKRQAVDSTLLNTACTFVFAIAQLFPDGLHRRRFKEVVRAGAGGQFGESGRPSNLPH